MLIIPRRYSNPADRQSMNTLIDSDNEGPWAIRYLCVQHRHDNNKFYNNYFNPDLTQPGMNIRKQTAELSNDWMAHNQIFYDSAANGNLVWRVKVANPINQSIDYVEIWRSVDVVTRYFGQNPAIQINNSITWESDDRNKFINQLFEAGFDIREWTGSPVISKMRAIAYYKMFVEQWREKKQCIINTQWNKEINPL